jgi:hypothetical protein
MINQVVIRPKLGRETQISIQIKKIQIIERDMAGFINFKSSRNFL